MLYQTSLHDTETKTCSPLLQTNSDGLLAVLGAAQILKSMKDGSAKLRTEESFRAVEE